MSVFFYSFIPIVASIFLKIKGLRHLEISFFLLGLISLFLILGFRAVEVGTDTANYYRMFYRIEGADDIFSLRYEPGYVLLNKFASFFELGPEFVIAICSLIIIFSVAFFIFKFSPFVGLSLLLFAALFGYFFAFNGMRQAVAQSLLLLGYTFYSIDKRIFAIMAYGFAPFVHYAAFIFFPFLLLLLIPLRILKLLLPSAWVFSLFFVINPSGFQWIANFLFLLVPEGYSSYTTNPRFDGGLGFRILFLQFFFIFIYISYCICKDATRSRIMLMACFAVIVSNVFTYSGFLKRISLFWEGFLIVAIPLALFAYCRGFNRSLIYFGLFGVSSIFFFRAVLIGSNNATPYSSWLF